MNSKFLKASEKKKLLRELEKQFGIHELPYTLIETGKKKVRGFSGTMTKDEILELSEIANVEIIGLYLLKREGRLRLSLDGTHVLKEQVSKNILEVDDAQVESWMKGNNIDLENVSINNSGDKPDGDDNNLAEGRGYDNKGVFVIKHRESEDFLGCGISDGKKILNHVPKERRIRRS